MSSVSTICSMRKIRMDEGITDISKSELRT